MEFSHQLWVMKVQESSLNIVPGTDEGSGNEGE